MTPHFGIDKATTSYIQGYFHGNSQMARMPLYYCPPGVWPKLGRERSRCEVAKPPSTYLLRQLLDTLNIHPGHTPSSTHPSSSSLLYRSLSIVTHSHSTGKIRYRELLAYAIRYSHDGQRKEAVLLICKLLQKYSTMVSSYRIFSRPGHQTPSHHNTEKMVGKPYDAASVSS